jgi:hypothetical protein
MYVEQRELTDYDRLIADLDAPLPDDCALPLEQLHSSQKLQGSRSARAPSLRSDRSPSGRAADTSGELGPTAADQEPSNDPTHTPSQES